MEKDIMLNVMDSFKTAIEALNLAAVSVCSFYNQVSDCREKLSSSLADSVKAFENDSSAKEQKHSEQKQKLDGVVADAEKQLKEAQKALSVAFVSDDEKQVKAAKQALSDAETELNQAKAARAVFDDAVGVQYDETLYNQIFSKEAELLQMWEKIVVFRNQVDENTNSAIDAMSKAKKAASYTDFPGLISSKRESLKARFNHDGSH